MLKEIIPGVSCVKKSWNTFYVRNVLESKGNYKLVEISDEDGIKEFWIMQKTGEYWESIISGSSENSVRNQFNNL